MTFTFKLSQRLSRMRCSALALATAALAACEKATPSVTGPSHPASQVARIIVSPDAITLAPTQSQQFSAYGRTEAGDSTAVAVTWSATAGTISPSGLYTPAAVGGVVQVNAAAAGGAPSGTATITVTGAPPASGGWTNEPAGNTVVSDYGFNDLFPVTDADVTIPGGSGWNSV